MYKYRNGTDFIGNGGNLRAYGAESLLLCEGEPHCDDGAERGSHRSAGKADDRCPAEAALCTPCDLRQQGTGAQGADCRHGHRPERVYR